MFFILFREVFLFLLTIQLLSFINNKSFRIKYICMHTSYDNYFVIRLIVTTTTTTAAAELKTKKHMHIAHTHRIKEQN